MSKPSKDKKELTHEQLAKVAGGERSTKRGDFSPYPRLHPKPTGSTTSSSSSTTGGRLLT